MGHRSSAISGVKSSSLFEILGEHGVNKAFFLDSLNIDASLFDVHEKKKLTAKQVKDLLEKAILLTKDKDLGLHLGQRSRFLPNIVCYIMMNCPTAGDALKKYSQYKKIFNDETNAQLSIKTDTAFLEMRSTASELSSLRAFNDYKLTTMYVFLQFLTGGKFELTGVTLKHNKPDNLSEYKKNFPCPVSFSKFTNALIFTKESLNLPINCPNKDLLKHFEQYAQKILDKIAAQDSLSKKVSQMLIEIIQSGESPSVELISKKSHMSVRKLQGILEKEKTTYIQLLHSVKKELAFVYLTDNQISSTEVSFLLGFSEPSAFYRAFKKWTGNTPGKFRTTQ